MKRAGPAVPHTCDPSTHAPWSWTPTAQLLACLETPTTHPAASSPVTQSSMWVLAGQRCQTASSPTMRAHLTLCPSSQR